jgi:hypothetical protein
VAASFLIIPSTQVGKKLSLMKYFLAQIWGLERIGLATKYLAPC